MLAAVAATGAAAVIDGVYPFEAIGEAQARMADGAFFGKLVIEFPG